MSDAEKVTYFAETDFRNQRSRFGIKNKDRSRHVYVIGKTGMGKSTLLENMAAQDILNGEGMCFMDPHGSAIDAIIDYIPPHRVSDVVYFAPFDTDFPMSFNVLEHVEPDKRHLVVAGLMASFKKIWVDSFSARMEYILANTLLALLEYPGATLLGVNRMLAEKDYRNDVIKHITDASVKAFWIDEYNKWDPRYAKEAGAAIQNKIGQFTSNPLIRNIVGQQKSAMDFRDVMDNQKILLVNLSKGLIGESNGNLLGGMLITKLYLAAMSRADVGAGNLEKLPNFFFFVDEFQNFANESFADILSEARKYKLNLTVAHQYVEQMEEQVSAAIFGNVGTMITFRIGATDAEVFEKQFAPTFTAEDIVNLGKFQIYLSLMIDGIGSRPFSGRTIGPIEKQSQSMRSEVIQASRAQFAEPRKEVEERINTWYEPINKPEKRSFRKEENTTTKKNDSKPLVATVTNKKQLFVATKNERDSANSSIKKAVKEVEEKEAELEMKKVVSPKLNDLLEKMGSTTTQRKQELPNAIKNIRDHDTTSEPLKKTGTQEHQTVKIPETISQKAKKITHNKIDSRGADTNTMSALQQALAKAKIQKQPRQEKSSPKPTSSRKETSPVDDVSKKRSSEVLSEKTLSDTRTSSQKLSHEKKQKQPQQKISSTNTKEVPEDILKSIFN